MYLKQDKDISIFLLMSIHNEAYYLPSFMDHIYRYIDKAVIYKDNCTDNSANILRGYGGLVKFLPGNPFLWFKNEYLRKKYGYFNERLTRQSLIKYARKKGAEVVLCLDADERIEKNFLENIREIARECYSKKVCFGLHFRELFGDIQHYRSDGIWNGKKKYILFPLESKMTFFRTMPNWIHTLWHYEQIDEKKYLSEFNIYHLKSIRSNDRIKRACLYERCDPDHKIQPFGYKYLFDETNLLIEKIPPEKSYATEFVPDDMKKSK